MVKIPTKTLKSGFSLPVLGLGTWQKNCSLEENLGFLGWFLKEKDLEELIKNYPQQLPKFESLPLR